jgi:Domain of unknown function (DUF4382)
MLRPNRRPGHALVATALCASLLASCGGSSTDNSNLTLQLTDAPPLSGLQSVTVAFTGVEVKPMSGKPIQMTFPSERAIDLLTLQHGTTATLLNGETIPAGQYEWVRLIVDLANSNAIDAQGAQHSLTIPSGAETGLKLIHGFTMPVGGTADFTIDFVLSRSLIAPPGLGTNYLLKPVLRMVDNAQVGTIAGMVSAPAQGASPQTNCSGGTPAGPNLPVVYVYAGAQVMPDDVYTGAAEEVNPTPPEVEPLLLQTVNAADYSFSIPFLTAGTYTVAFTCDNDDSTVDESATPGLIHFTTFSTDVTVSANATATVDF